MKCREVRKRLAEQVAGELFPSEQEVIAAHLAQCAACRAEASVLERCERALGVLGAVAEAPDLSEDLRQRIAVPLPWRPRWGVAAAVAGAALAVTAMAVLLLGPRKAPAPGVPMVREDVTEPAVVSMPHALDVTLETPAETSPPARSPLVSVSAPRPVPAEVVLQQAIIPAVVSVPGQGQPAGLAEEAAIEAAPLMASLTTQPERGGGVILLLGQPEPVRPASSCYLEVSLPNGARSVFERVAKPDVAGRPRAISISYEETTPEGSTAQQGG
jgi:predicted anti-sigma-YlaC factor YlaD